MVALKHIQKSLLDLTKDWGNIFITLLPDVDLKALPTDPEANVLAECLYTGLRQHKEGYAAREISIFCPSEFNTLQNITDYSAVK